MTRALLPLLALAAALAACPAARPAQAQLFGTEALDPKFCERPTYRQTVVYIDDMMMVEGRTEWATKLSDKLRATLAPGERVTVVRMSPNEGSSREMWSGCWPAFTEAELTALRAERRFFTANPADKIVDQQKFFLQGFGSALTRIYTETKRPAAQARFSAQNAPKKQIIRALAADDGRFSNSRLTVRAIIYSDMVENSDLGSSLEAAGGPGGTQNYGQRLGTYLRRSVFYAFGVGEDVTDAAGFNERARMFWSAALRSMAATVGGIGSDLNVPNIFPSHAVSLPVELTYEDQKLDGRLSLLMNDQGDLVDSWLGISRLTSTSLTGTYRCRPSASEPTCRLDATTTSGLLTKEPSETIALAGTERQGLKGQLGVKGTKAMFDITTLPVRD